MNRIFIGKGERPVYLLAKYGNRYEMVAGATGTGKTISLQVLAGGFSRLGVPILVERTLICPPRCRIGAITPPLVERKKVSQTWR